MDGCAYSIEQRFEFDAPHFHDFNAEPTSSSHSGWFANLEEDGAAVEKEPVSTVERAPLGNITNEQPKKTNIVTSWGAPEVKKRKAQTGGPEQPSAKAARPADGDVVVPRAPKISRQHAAPTEVADVRKKKPKKSKAAAEELADSDRKKSKKLKVVGGIKKLKKIRDKAALAKCLQKARSTKELTIPDEIELRTSKRADAHQTKRGKQVERDICDGEDEPGPEGDGSPYKPLVLRVKEFDKTPGRFKKQPDQPLPPCRLTITDPKEPQLRTTMRVRPTTFKPREVEEEEEMAKIPHFKASTLNPLILSHSGKLGVPIVEKRELTEPRPFNFVTDDRAEERAARLKRQEVAEAFPSGRTGQRTDAEHGGDKSARGFPLKPRKSVFYHPTEPKSPQLHTKQRVRETKTEEPNFQFHARPVPKFLSVPRSLELPPEVSLAPTQPAPFNLATDKRGSQYQQALAAKLAAEEEAARRARVPRAQGIPLSTDMPILPPRPEPRKLTVPQPFELASEARHHHYEEQLRKALEDEEAAKREAADFRARPMWRGIPFRLHEPDMPLTVAEDVPLYTSSRAAEREAFNRAIEEKLKEAEIKAQLAAEEARMREEEERRKARKAAVFKANPMPDLSVPEVVKAPPPKPVTKPVSPRLGRSKPRRKSGH